ncbi:glycine zipper 2TM domain-containing protein [Massilia sp. YIM B02769]|uniref:glycine zipper 2TM domain-containing protein n=1 Tax=Massilia sp. YIM B02769 TaxID=3050129 RepID=UPI0025B6D493|nr:glycine zipper 2TM domain-containing protein [Massilia sp. YIM B02769]MDN4059405.1 glycine zipper 2TM domain-containing protein [Massilia sp. YIM B02769]
MTTTQATTRIHPLMAAAAASVIIVSLTGAAAITGLLPSSRSAPEAQAVPLAATQPVPAAAQLQPAALPTQLAAAPAPVVVTAAPGTTTYVQPTSANAPVIVVKQEPAPVVKHTVVKQTVVQKPRVVEHRPAPQPVRYAEPTYQPAPAPAPVQQGPSYVGVATGAVIGGLIGNQVGGGNGKKLATLAGVIGGGYLGNEIAQRNAGNR